MPTSTALRLGCRRLRPVAVLLALAASMASPARAADPTPLHERIDALLEAGYLGPLSRPATDDEFVRRIYLDLVGVIPTAAEARAFCDDADANKRAALVDRLLASPEHARHSANQFDVMLNERRADKTGNKTPTQPDWLTYLYESRLKNVPFNQLARDLLAAESKDETRPTTTRFYVDRDVEPNVITRDIGRIFFGMDLQCAQCHNHPIVDDYLQSDYYGLFAFVSRTYVFRNKAREPSLAEKPDGEASFKSVFTGFAMDKVPPRVPKGLEPVEPVVAKGEEYVVAPAKDIKPIPKVSRRALLADAATSGANAAFNRNIVNRLWAQLFGRGIVHPVDMHHPDNPPSNPALLALLAEEFVKLKFDVRAFQRELVLTRAYQRACDAPAPEAAMKIEAAPRAATLAAENEKLQTAAKTSQEAVEKVAVELTAAREAAVAAKPDAAKVAAAQAAAKQAADKAAAELAAAQKDAQAKQEVSQLVGEAAAKAKQAVQKLSADAALAAAAQQFADRAAALAAELKQAQDVVAQRTAAVKTANDEIAKLAAPSDAEQKAREKVLALDTQLMKAREQAARDSVAAADVAARLAEAQGLVEFQKLAAQAEQSKKPEDQSAATLAWEKLIEKWEPRYAWMPLKALSPEQLAWSSLQVAGSFSSQRAAVEAELAKKPPEGVNMADASQKAIAVEKAAYAKLQGNLGAFVGTFGNGAGQPPDVFLPSVGQALFVGNGPLVQGLLSSVATGLNSKFKTAADAPSLADEMYGNVLTRRATDDEKAEVASFLNGRDADRAAAIQEMLWGLVSSIEFRFNH